MYEEKSGNPVPDWQQQGPEVIFFFFFSGVLLSQNG
jgi:hypothetical protein